MFTGIVERMTKDSCFRAVGNENRGGTAGAQYSVWVGGPFFFVVYLPANVDFQGE